jgi:hypothetical protein
MNFKEKIIRKEIEYMENKDIFEWLEKQNYQTEYEETGEYKMYFDLDMPKILEDYYNWRKNNEINDI